MNGCTGTSPFRREYKYMFPGMQLSVMFLDVLVLVLYIIFFHRESAFSPWHYQRPPCWQASSAWVLSLHNIMGQTEPTSLPCFKGVCRLDHRSSYPPTRIMLRKPRNAGLYMSSQITLHQSSQRLHRMFRL